MLTLYLSKIFGKSTFYRKDQWFQDLEESQMKYLRMLLILGFSFTLFILSAFIPEVLSHSPRIPVSVFVLFCLLNLILLAFSVFRVFPLLGWLLAGMNLMLAAGIFLLPRHHHLIYIFLLFTPIMVFEVLGRFPGWIYSFLLVSIGLSMSLLGNPEYLPFVSVSTSIHFLISSVPGMIFIACLILFFYALYDRYLYIYVHNILFDRVTGLPGQNILRHRIKPDTRYLFAIVRTVNFSELGLIFGYGFSDRIIHRVADRLEGLGKEMDFSVYRLRGNDFGILWEEKVLSRGVFLEKVRLGLERTTIPWQKSQMRLNFVIGATSTMNEMPKEFLSQADIALKDGVEKHRTVSLFEGENTIREVALEHLNRYNILKENIDNHGLEVHFQPIIDSKTGNVFCRESLLRIRNATGGLDSPEDYLGLAESTGIYPEISRFVLKEACEAIRYYGGDVSININLDDLLRPNFIDLLHEYYIPVREEGRLILEILERQELHMLKECKEFLDRAHQLGCLVAIDDFGSGYSNYCNVLKIPVDIIKIDGSLIQQMKECSSAAILVQNIIQFSKELNLKTVAEYVDCPNLASVLAESGVDYFQGWLYAKAEPLQPVAK